MGDALPDAGDIFVPAPPPPVLAAPCPHPSRQLNYNDYKSRYTSTGDLLQWVRCSCREWVRV